MGNFPSSVSDSSRPFFGTGGVPGPAGQDAIYLYPSTPVVPIPSDADGGNPSYASNTSEILVYIAGVIQTGWTLAYSSGSNCVGTVNNGVEPRTASITSVTADSGYADFTATKNGVTLYFRLHFAKAKAGATGPAGADGNDGATGDTGATGPAGTAGTGVVLIKKSIAVSSGVTASGFSDGGSSNTLITFSSDHGYSVGDWIHVYSSGGYNDEVQVETTPLSTTLTVAIPYTATGNPMYVFNMENLRNLALITGQNLVFPDVLSAGMKPIEIHLVCTNDSIGAIQAAAGNAQYPNSGWSNYFSGGWVANEGQIVSRDLRNSPLAMRVLQTDNDIWLRFTTTTAWNLLTANTWELHIAYINYDLTYTP